MLSGVEMLPRPPPPALSRKPPGNKGDGAGISHVRGPMIPVHNLFEAHFTVADFDRSVTFYRDGLHLQLAHAVAARRAAFFWIGPAGHAMLGLWETGSGPQRMIAHTASRTSP